MGWERKRGKIEEFNRLLRDASDTSFRTSPATSRSCRTCATASRSTATRGCLATPRESLIGIILHPLNYPRVDRGPARHRGLRHSAAARQRHAGSAAGSLFARVYAGHTGVDPYTTAVSDVYQDLFRRRHLRGQGSISRGLVQGHARGTRSRERAPVTRPVRGPPRARGTGQRRRGRGRLPGDRSGARAAPASLGAR